MAPSPRTMWPTPPSPTSFLFSNKIWEIKGEKKRERERGRFVVPLICALIGWFLHVPWLGSDPKPWCSNQLRHLQHHLSALIPHYSLENSCTPHVLPCVSWNVPQSIALALIYYLFQLTCQLPEELPNTLPNMVTHSSWHITLLFALRDLWLLFTFVYLFVVIFHQWKVSSMKAGTISALFTLTSLTFWKISGPQQKCVKYLLHNWMSRCMYRNYQCKN